MASTAQRGALVLSIGTETLRGTVGGATHQCRVHLGAGLRARITPAVYRFSSPTKGTPTGTVAYATYCSTGLRGGQSGDSAPVQPHPSTPEGLRRDKLQLDSPPVDPADRDGQWFTSEPVELNVSPSWHSDSKESPHGLNKGDVPRPGRTPSGGPGTLVFAAQAMGGWNDVVVLSGFDGLMKALQASGGCALIVSS